MYTFIYIYKYIVSSLKGRNPIRLSQTNLNRLREHRNSLLLKVTE